MIHFGRCWIILRLGAGSLLVRNAGARVLTRQNCWRSGQIVRFHPHLIFKAQSLSVHTIPDPNPYKYFSWICLGFLDCPHDDPKTLSQHGQISGVEAESELGHVFLGGLPLTPTLILNPKP